MTVGGIILCVVISLILLVGTVYAIWAFEDNHNTVGIVLSAIFGIGLIAVTWVLGFWYFNHTESGKRAMKSQESNFNGGITRKVSVYDVQGDVIAEYQGKFDVDYDNDRIVFDDELGHRHIIYYPTGTVIVDEVE
jgi:cell division protein FtsI/penicillin-binding protein 2